MSERLQSAVPLVFVAAAIVIAPAFVALPAVYAVGDLLAPGAPA